MVPKRIYLVDRGPGLTRETFPGRWEQHAALGRGFRELAHNYPSIAYCFIEHDVAGIPRARAEHDGIGLLWMRGPEAINATFKDPAIAPTMRADECRVFSDVIRARNCVAEEVLLRDGPRTPVCLISLLKRRAGTTRDEFLGTWRDGHGPVVVAATGFAAGLHRYAQNHIIEEPSLDCDGVAEFWFDDLAAARTACSHPDYAGRILRHQDTFADPASPSYLTTIRHAWPPEQGSVA